MSANVFMGHHENIWLETYRASNNLNIYRCYVDDTFCVFETEQDALLFFDFFNTRHPNIRFTMEKDVDHKLPFLHRCREVGQTDTVSVINTAKKGIRQRNATSKQGKACGNCGRHHEIGNCAARGKLCNECGKLNHFASVCCSEKRRTGAQKDVKTVEELAEFDESDGEIYVIGEISAVTLDDSQLVTVKLASGNCL